MTPELRCDGRHQAPWQTVIGPTSPYYNKKLNNTYKFSVSKAKALKQAGIRGTTIKGLARTQLQPQFAEIVRLS